MHHRHHTQSVHDQGMGWDERRQIIPLKEDATKEFFSSRNNCKGKQSKIRQDKKTQPTI